MKSALVPARFAWLVALLTLAATGLLPASPAAAAIPGLQRVVTTSPLNSVGNPKVASAACPAGKNVIGTGGYVTGGNGQVVLTEILPDTQLTKVRAVAYEDATGYGGNWSVTAVAVCANPPSGLQRVATQSATNSDDKDLTASCPNAKRTLGLGARLNGFEGRVFLNALQPFAQVSGHLYASEDKAGLSGNWSATLVLMCADPVPGLTSITNWSTGGSSSPKSVAVACPAGTVAISAGGMISAGIGDYGQHHVLIDRLDVSAALDHGTAGAAEAEGGVAYSWHAVTIPLCAEA